MKPSDAADAARSILDAAGLKRTPVRLAVLGLLLRDGTGRQALTAQEVHGRLPAGTDAVTVYRTMATLTEKGVLHAAPGEGRAARYAIGGREPGPAHRHPHFLCDDCGRSECLTAAAELPPAAAAARLGEGYELRYAEVIVHGRCPDCARPPPATPRRTGRARRGP